MSLIYCATTDATVHANPWEGMPVDSSFFYDLVLQNFLVGNRLLLNAGDIFHHPILRQELVETPKSLARTLVQLGQICVLGELVEPPAVLHIHAKKIAATQALVRNHNAVVKRPCESLVNAEFGRLMQQLPARDPAGNGFFIGAIAEREYGLIVSSYIKMASPTAGGRELFLYLVDKLYGQTQGPWQNDSKNKLLQLMADIYACATARALVEQLGERVGVDTQWSATLGWAMPFRPLLMTPLSGPVSLLKLPWPNSLFLPKIAQMLLTDGDIGLARTAFIAAWRNLQTGEITAGLVAQLREAAEEFNRDLHQLVAKSGSKDTMANPANLVLSFQPTSFKGAPVVEEVYWQQAFSGARRVMAIWNFAGSQTGPVDAHSLPAYELIYGKKKSASVLL